MAAHVAHVGAGCSHVRTGCALRLSVFIHLCENLLRALLQLLLRRFHLCDIGIGHAVCIFMLVNEILECREVCFDGGLVCRIELVTDFVQCLLCLEYEGVCIVSRVDRLFALLVLRLILCCFLDSAVDFLIGHIGACRNGNVLLLACPEILCRYIDDTNRIDIEGHFDLRYAAACGRDAVQTELSQ